jgi:hypothetical protein
LLGSLVTPTLLEQNRFNLVNKILENFYATAEAAGCRLFGQKQDRFRLRGKPSRPFPHWSG